MALYGKKSIGLPNKLKELLALSEDLESIKSKAEV
jgi:hypothetical protein